MKTTIQYIAAVILITLMSLSAIAQKDNEIRIKIMKKKNGKTEVIDTIIHIPGDSVMAFWTTPDHKKIEIKTDSIMRVVQKRMEKINMDSIMKEVDKKMKHMDVHMKKLNDSVLEHKIKVIMPRLKHLDSIHEHDLKVKLKHLDSAHKKLWIMKTDSLEEIDFNIKFDFDLDSLMKESQKKMLMLDTMDFQRHLPDMEDLHESIREGMKHARFVVMEDDFEWESADKQDIRYIDGKIIKIKTDANGKVQKAIVMSPDGEDIEIKEGVEAYNFITEEGEQIIIVTKVELKEVDKTEKKKLSKKGIETENQGNRLEAEDMKAAVEYVLRG